MVLFMARPTKRSGSTKGRFRRRVPADILRIARGKSIAFSLPKSHSGDERIIVSAKIGNEVLFSLRTEDPSLIKLRHGVALEQFERACAAHREGPRRLIDEYADINASQPARKSSTERRVDDLRYALPHIEPWLHEVTPLLDPVRPEEALHGRPTGARK